MLFSVIIPCYNSSPHIAIPLASLVGQTCSDFEVIIVDDASSDFDAMLLVLNQFREQLVCTVLRNETHQYGAAARNRGIAEARGRFLTFLDSDDRWVPNRLEEAYRFISNIKEDRFVLFGNIELLRDHSTGAILPRRDMYNGEMVSDYVFSCGQMMSTITIVCPSGVARSILFDERLQRHQDSDFMMRAQAFGFAIIRHNFKCGDYLFSPTGLRQRVSSGRISPATCVSYLEAKKQYFTPSAIAGYRLSVLARVFFVGGDYFESFAVTILSVSKLPRRQLLQLLATKLYIIWKSTFGR
jgi:glycosyltransferase involved in cell wall biosynthesis